jgi:hypothetical protein
MTLGKETEIFKRPSMGHRIYSAQTNLGIYISLLKRFGKPCMYALKEWNKHLIKHLIKSAGILLIELFEIQQDVGCAG